jgi:hypothetical protein
VVGQRTGASQELSLNPDLWTRTTSDLVKQWPVVKPTRAKKAKGLKGAAAGKRRGAPIGSAGWYSQGMLESRST